MLPDCSIFWSIDIDSCQDSLSFELGSGIGVIGLHFLTVATPRCVKHNHYRFLLFLFQKLCQTLKKKVNVTFICQYLKKYEYLLTGGLGRCTISAPESSSSHGASPEGSLRNDTKESKVSFLS